ncbi:Endosomal protein P24B [Porphyridium purpureum]|uniref:Endosomal protein P24B n=1 Tax=Porphyridium purpureum TaxID=35688 RepID=A0A5J4YWV8_PORPP|nr:Endosomal protein P24B [Porphyridium purpureum]|eukprot:POR6067..scf209_3
MALALTPPRRGMVAVLVILAATWASAPRGCDSIIFELVGPSQDDCFFEDGHQGDKIAGSFGVISPPDAKLLVAIHGPSDEAGETPLFTADKVAEGHFNLMAEETGTYRYCFKLADSFLRKASVAFVLESENEVEVDLEALAKVHQLDSVGLKIVDINSNARRFMREVHGHEIRAQRMLEVVKRTESSKRFWSRLLIVQVIGFAAVQVVFLHRTYGATARKRSRRGLVV